MSITRVLRISGTFSLKVRPSTVTTGLLVWLVSAYSGRARRPWLGMVGATVGSYLLIGIVAFAVSSALLLEQLASVFVISASLLAAGAVALTWLVSRLGPRSRG